MNNVKREIKFRAWSIEKQSWIYFGIENVPEWVSEHEAEQYTGLKDKNGKEIYFRSDKVRAEITDNFTGEDISIEGYLFIDLKRFKICLSGHEEFNLQYADSLEIIGNIHEEQS